MNKLIVIVTCIISLTLINFSIYSKEKHLSEGKFVLLELAPVDPRSLMQGDYMALRFAMANDASLAVRNNHELEDAYRLNYDGHIIANINDNSVATFNRLNDETQLSEDEKLIKFRIRNGVVKFATNAFFFQEGHAKYYENAKYGGFRVNRYGELLLTGMYDESLKEISPSNNDD